MGRADRTISGHRDLDRLIQGSLDQPPIASVLGQDHLGIAGIRRTFCHAYRDRVLFNRIILIFHLVDEIFQRGGKGPCRRVAVILHQFDQ